ncbi:MAG: PAS domain S-box protein [Caldilineaceae bacterium]|nr:PAS domain S-box protein [Caldilinea sp.]MCB0137304.1 PAS domain S-box protein [Caldilineaceae bacterium]HRW46510.1 PAS domain S-box protein [Caldilinea sp.]
MHESTVPGESTSSQVAEAAMEELPVAACVIGGNGLRLLLANAAFRALAPEGMLVGVSVDGAEPAPGRRFGKICREVLESGITQSLIDVPSRLLRDTSEAPEEAFHTWVFQRLELPGDVEQAVICIAWEATEHGQTDNRLRESEERYRQLLEVSPVGVAVHAGGTLVFTNPAGATLLGASTPEDLIGTPITRIIHPANLAAAAARIGRMMAGETGLYPVEDRYVRLDGQEIDVEVMAVSLAYEGKPAVQVIVQDITERKRAEEELRLSRDRLAQLSLRLVEAQESERRAIGRELHDQFGQMLTAMKITLDIAAQLPPDAAARKIAQAQELAGDLLSRVSRLSMELRPAMLDDLGLVPALVWLINRFQQQAGIDVTFKHSGVEGRRFAPVIETTAFRIVQEALTNIARHAQAMHAGIRVSSPDGWLEIEIDDNGVGFDPKEALANRRGLTGMRERALLVNGTFAIESSPGQGTHKLIRLPISEENA